MIDRLEAIFSPRAVAVVGASESQAKLGFHVMKSLVRSGYQGGIYPINPKSEQILGLQVYKSLDETPGAVDLAVIVVPAQMVPEQIAACARRGVKGVVLITAGFKEIEEESGARLQAEVARLANQAGIPIIGPNTFGILNLQLPLNASFTPELSLAPRGKVSLLSQSGGITHLAGFMAMAGRIGLAKMVGLGNRCNVDFAQMLPYLAQDSQTAAIAMYIEGIEDQAEFLEQARLVSSHKPIVAYKSGRSEVADQASASHTGSMAGRHELYLAGFRQNGIQIAESLEQLMDCAKALAYSPTLAGPRVAVLSGQAGLAITACDFCGQAGLSMASFKPATQERINELLPPLAMRTNPVDLGPAWYSSEAISEIVEAVLHDEQVDGLLLNMIYASANLNVLDGMLDPLIKWNQRKPVLTSFSAPPGIWDDQIALLEESGAIVNFPSPERAAQAMGSLYARNLILRKLSRDSFGKQTCEGPIMSPTGGTSETADATAKALVEQAKRQGRTTLSEYESKALVAAYGIPVNRGVLVEDSGELAVACRDIGYPLVLKASGPGLAHKTEHGLVWVNLSSLEQAKAAYEKIQAQAPGPVYVQEMVRGQRELVMGMTRDAQFGPSVMFGLGGIFTEVLNDVSFRLAPLDQNDALEMLREIKGRDILGPLRGMPPADLETLAAMLVGLGRLGMDLKDVAEVDLNPLILAGDQPVAVDALVVLTKP